MIWAAAQWIALRRKWSAGFVLMAAGAVSTLALPPWGGVPCLALGFVVLVWSLSGAQTSRAVFFRTWVFATAHFLPALWWVSQSMITKGGAAVYMVPFTIFGLPAVLALFPSVSMGLLFSINFRLRRGATHGWVLIPVLVALGWSLSEVLRTYLFTGFPWHMMGYAWVDLDAPLQAVSVFGVLGVGLLTVLAAVSPAVIGLTQFGTAERRKAWAFVGSGVALVGLMWGLGEIRLRTALLAQSESGPVVRVVQPNVRQQDKWRRETRDRQILDLIRLTGQEGISDVDLVIWPETAITFLVQRDPRLLNALGSLLEPEQQVVGGTVTAEWDEAGTVQGVYNAMLVIDDEGSVVDEYRKRHLVPFGEYLPFRSVLEPLGVAAVAAESDFSSGSGSPLISMPRVGMARVLICYEAIFPQDLFGSGVRPDVLVVGTNDAWFGNTIGPQQHAAMSRVRALEWGVPMVRAANTGVSLIADAFGREVQRLDMLEQGQITQRLPAKLINPPLYTYWGDGVYVLLFVSVLLAVGFLQFRGLRSHA